MCGDGVQFPAGDSRKRGVVNPKVLPETIGMRLPKGPRQLYRGSSELQSGKRPPYLLGWFQGGRGVFARYEV